MPEHPHSLTKLKQSCSFLFVARCQRSTDPMGRSGGGGDRLSGAAKVHPSHESQRQHDSNYEKRGYGAGTRVRLRYGLATGVADPFVFPHHSVAGWTAVHDSLKRRKYQRGIAISYQRPVPCFGRR